jgi:hypothetical protein
VALLDESKVGTTSAATSVWAKSAGGVEGLYSQLMGRARQTQTATVVAADVFASVLGTRRGSQAAQAQRDTDERAQQDVALDQFMEQVVVRKSGGSVPYLGANTEMLVRAYWAQRPPAEVVAELEATLAVLDRSGQRLMFLEGLALLVDLGDPVSCPGLTAPALQMLSAYFGGIGNESTQARDCEAEWVIRQVFVGVRAAARAQQLRDFKLLPRDLDRKRSEADYRRWQPLAESLATMIVRSPSPPPGGGEGGDGATSASRAAEALTVVSAATLAGPLRCWVDAFSKRREHVKISADERSALLRVDAAGQDVATAELFKRLVA